MENLDDEAKVANDKFPCIVCSSETKSVEDLHNHQKHFHTTEELSLSVICLVHYMCVKYKDLGIDVASKYPALLKNHATNYRFCQPHHRFDTNSNGCAVHSSTLCNEGRIEKIESFLGKTRIVKVHEQSNQARHYPFIPPGDLRIKDQLLVDTKMISPEFDTPFICSSELELNRFPEISDETFLNCVNGICKELEMNERLANTRSRGFLKPGNRTNEGKKRNVKRTARSQKSFVPLSKGTSTKGLQRSQTCVKSPVVYHSKQNVDDKREDPTPIAYSSTNNDVMCEDPMKLDEKGQELCKGGIKTENGNADAQRFYRDLLYKEIPVLEKASGNFNCEHEPGEMPVLEPHLPTEELL